MNLQTIRISSNQKNHANRVILEVFLKFASFQKHSKFNKVRKESRLTLYMFSFWFYFLDFCFHPEIISRYPATVHYHHRLRTLNGGGGFMVNVRMNFALCTHILSLWFFDFGCNSFANSYNLYSPFVFFRKPKKKYILCFYLRVQCTFPINPQLLFSLCFLFSSSSLRHHQTFCTRQL